MNVWHLAYTVFETSNGAWFVPWRRLLLMPLPNSMCLLRPHTLPRWVPRSLHEFLACSLARYPPHASHIAFYRGPTNYGFFVPLPVCPWLVRPLADSPPVFFAPWLVRPLYLIRWFTPWLVYCLVRLPPGLFAPWLICLSPFEYTSDSLLKLSIKFFNSIKTWLVNMFHSDNSPKIIHLSVQIYTDKYHWALQSAISWHSYHWRLSSGLELFRPTKHTFSRGERPAQLLTVMATAGNMGTGQHRVLFVSNYPWTEVSKFHNACYRQFTELKTELMLIKFYDMHT